MDKVKLGEGAISLGDYVHCCQMQLLINSGRSQISIHAHSLQVFKDITQQSMEIIYIAHEFFQNVPKTPCDLL